MMKLILIEKDEEKALKKCRVEYQIGTTITYRGEKENVNRHL